MFYKYIDSKTCPTAAPYPLIINGKNVFTNDKKIYNNHGYYEIISTPYPQDGKEYFPIYSLKNNSIVQEWEEIRNKLSYDELVVQLIREKYSLDDELAIQRQKETKPDEWEAYFAYCEECKKKAKKVLEAKNE